MKYVRESLEESKVSLEDVTWDDIKPEKDDKKWTPDYVNVPYDYMSSLSINSEKKFEKWYDKFIEEYGTEGYLVKWSPTSWKLTGNKKWDEINAKLSKGVSGYYDKKRSGEYTGD